MPTAAALPAPTVPQDLSLNDLIFELAKAKNVTTQAVHAIQGTLHQSIN